MVGADCAGVGVPLIDITVDYDFNVGDGFAIFWSNAPWAVPAAFVIFFLTTRRISALFLAWVTLVASGINEGIWARIHKEPRPSQSCIDGDAMPSGHASLSFACLTFSLLEITFSFYWSWPRKIWLAFVALVVLFPIGPFRTYIHDHTWEQVAAGWLWGLIWGSLNFIVIRFLLIRFAWEPMQCVKFIRWLLQNDYDPDFKYSQWKGKKYEASVPEDREYKDYHFWDKNPLVLIFYFAIALANLVLGVFGIIAGPVQKHRDNTCDRASWGLSIGAGVMNIVTALGMFVLIPMMMFLKMEVFKKRLYKRVSMPEGAKQKKKTASKYLFAKTLNPFDLDDLGYFVLFFWVESLTWVIAGMYTINDGCSVNIITVYLSLWIGQAGIVIITAILIFVAWSIYMIIWRCRGGKNQPKGRKSKERDEEMGVQGSA